MKAKILGPVLVIVFLWSWLYISSYGGLSFYINWRQTKIGDTKSEALDRLGDPCKESKDFDFWVMDHHERLAKESGASFYLTWIKSIDTVFILGFDENENVTYKVHGGS